MEFGISIPNFRGAAHTDTFRRVAGAAEEAGLDDVWIGDHIVLARHITSPHPYSSKEKMTGRKPWSEAGIGDMEATDPVYEPLTLLGFLAALTERIRLALGTLVVPLRHPVVAAKMLSTLDVLCGGRLILGVGVGWIPEEYAAVGASWSDRGAVTDEYLDVMTALWREDHPGFEGRFYSLPPDICFYPKPVQRTIPIWVGATALRPGDGPPGWEPDGMEPSFCQSDCRVSGRTSSRDWKAGAGTRKGSSSPTGSTSK